MFHKSALTFSFYELFPAHFIYMLLQQVKKIKIYEVCFVSPKCYYRRCLALIL